MVRYYHDDISELYEDLIEMSTGLIGITGYGTFEVVFKPVYQTVIIEDELDPQIDTTLLEHYLDLIRSVIYSYKYYYRRRDNGNLLRLLGQVPESIDALVQLSKREFEEVELDFTIGFDVSRSLQITLEEAKTRDEEEDAFSHQGVFYIESGEDEEILEYIGDMFGITLFQGRNYLPTKIMLVILERQIIIDSDHDIVYILKFEFTDADSDPKLGDTVLEDYDLLRLFQQKHSTIKESMAPYSYTSNRVYELKDFDVVVDSKYYYELKWQRKGLFKPVKFRCRAKNTEKLAKKINFMIEKTGYPELGIHPDEVIMSSDKFKEYMQRISNILESL